MTARAERSAVLEHGAGGAAAFDDHFAHGGIDRDAHPVRGRRARHGLRDRAHAADGVAPDAFLAVHFAEGVMQEHVRGARRIGTGEVADHRVEAEHGLDGVGLEPAVEHRAGGFAKQVEGRLQPIGLPQPLADAGELAKLAQGAREISQQQVGRRLEHEAAQHRGDAAHFRLVFPVARRVPGAELADFRFGAAGSRKEIASVREGKKILHAALDDGEPALGELQVADHLGRQKTDGVGRARIAKTRVKLLGHAGAADHTAALENVHAQSRHAEIGRADQPVVTGADDDGVELGHGFSVSSLALAP